MDVERRSRLCVIIIEVTVSYYNLRQWWRTKDALVCCVLFLGDLRHIELNDPILQATTTLTLVSERVQCWVSRRGNVQATIVLYSTNN